MLRLLDLLFQARVFVTGDPVSWLRSVGELGDRNAFVALFHQFAPRVKSYLLRLGLSQGQAEELAQETMLQVWRKAASYNSSAGSPAAWILAIARNLRIDAARRESTAARKDIILNPLADELPPLPPDAEVDALERADRVRRAIALLPFEQAEVLRLSFFDDRPHAEIERLLGIPLGTVKSRLRLALARLRTLLDELR
jgi:RNA polymerase sigma-70 factor (ECF subfamily)